MNANERLPGPDFLCIGARKTGTTWLYGFLRKHPGCFMPRVKEINFFNSVLFTAPPGKAPQQALVSKWADFRGKKKLPKETPMPEAWLTHPVRWYRRTYAREQGIVSGDVSPLYQDIPAGRIAAIRAAIPEAKILYILRHPLERVLSDFSMLTNNRGIDVSTLTDADCMALLREHYGNSIRYVDIFQRWHAHFPVVVLWYEELRRDPQAFAAQVCDALGIAHMPELASETSNPNPSKSYGPRPQLSANVKRQLAGMVLPEAEAAQQQWPNEWTAAWVADLRQKAAAV